jgi:hypothetical protein
VFLLSALNLITSLEKHSFYDTLERSEAIERHEVPLEYLNATSWCSSTSLRLVFNSRFAAFKRCCPAFKSIIFHKLTSCMRLLQSLNEDRISSIQ